MIAAEIAIVLGIVVILMGIVVVYLWKRFMDRL